MVQAALGLVDALRGVLDMFDEKPQPSQRLLLLLLLGSFNDIGALGIRRIGSWVAFVCRDDGGGSGSRLSEVIDMPAVWSDLHT